VGITFVLGDQARDVGRIAGDLSLQSQFAASGLVSNNDRSHAPQSRNGGSRNGGSRRGARGGRGR